MLVYRFTCIQYRQVYMYVCAMNTVQNVSLQSNMQLQNYWSGNPLSSNFRDLLSGHMRSCFIPDSDMLSVFLGKFYRFCEIHEK